MPFDQRRADVTLIWRTDSRYGPNASADGQIQPISTDHQAEEMRQGAFEDMSTP
jgi:hypothetical protein